MKLASPYPYMGGKSRIADLVWSRLGDVSNYVEPFYGSGAVLLGRETAPRTETINDVDCYLANFWRAVKSDPWSVAEWAGDPINEADLHARHLWLVSRVEFRERLKTDPHFCDAKIAGWWVHGQCQWIGGGYCKVPRENIAVERRRPQLKNGMGVHRKLPELRRSGTGVHRKRPGFKRGGAGVFSVKRRLPSLGGDGSGSGRGILRWGGGNLIEWFEALADRLRRVRVCCGDFERVLGPTPTFKIGLTGVFLDPPYCHLERDRDIYASDDPDASRRARDWAVKNGSNPKLRIALCGYEGEHVMPPDWECVAWKAPGGYAGENNHNNERERVWFSPHCLKPQEELFES